MLFLIQHHFPWLVWDIVYNLKMPVKILIDSILRKQY